MESAFDFLKQPLLSKFLNGMQRHLDADLHWSIQKDPKSVEQIIVQGKKNEKTTERKMKI
jgi:hypothetical protein